MSLFGGRRDGDGAREQEPRAQSDAAGRGEGPGIRERVAQMTGGTAAAVTGGSVANIGKSIVFKGDLTGDEDLQVDGNLEGGIQLANHELTIGETGRVQAQLYAKSVVVIGHVTGNITATERVELKTSAVVEGDIHTPKLVVAEGAIVNGQVEMTKTPPEARKGAGGPTPSPATTAQPRGDKGDKPGAGA